MGIIGILAITSIIVLVVGAIIVLFLKYKMEGGIY